MKISLFSAPINSLREYYAELGFFSKLFFPKSLKTVLENQSALDIDVIYAANSANSWVYRRVFSRGLNPFFKSPAIRLAQWLVNPHALPTYLEGKINNLDKLNQSIDPSTQDAVTELTSQLNRMNRLQAFFFPRALARALYSTPPLATIQIIQIANQHISFFHKRFFPKMLRQFFSHPGVQATQHLITEQALPAGKQRIERNYNTIHSLPHPTEMASILCGLSTDKNPSKAQRNLDALRTHEQCIQVANALLLIDQTSTLDQSTFNQVLNGFNSRPTINTMAIIENMGLLNGDNMRLLMSKKELTWIAFILNQLHQQALFTSIEDKQQALTALLAHEQPYELYLAIQQLSQHRQLTATTFNTLLSRHNPHSHAMEWVKPNKPLVHASTTPPLSMRGGLFARTNATVYPEAVHDENNSMHLPQMS